METQFIIKVKLGQTINKNKMQKDKIKKKENPLSNTKKIKK